MKFSKEMTEKMESQIKDLTQKGLEKANKNHHENTVFTPRPSLGPVNSFYFVEI